VFVTISSGVGSPGAQGIAAGDCSTQGAGFKDTYTYGIQVTWGGGADLKGEGFNINLSSEDGWSSDAYLTFQTGSESAPVCGTTGYPNDPYALGNELAVH
jgi:hypothetical protein